MGSPDKVGSSIATGPLDQVAGLARPRDHRELYRAEAPRSPYRLLEAFAARWWCIAEICMEAKEDKAAQSGLTCSASRGDGVPTRHV